MDKKIIKIYDPAMCCPTGVCGTSVDTKLVQIANFLNNLDKNLFEVNRYSLSSNPEQYILNKQVQEILNTKGVDELPLIFLNEELIFSKNYPQINELSLKLGINALKF